MENPKTEEVLTLGLKLASLRAKLGQKAKREPKFRFYTLYGLIFREDVLNAAWERVYRNRGAAGVDNVSFATIKNSTGGVGGFLKEIQKDLCEKTYRPQPVKRVYIPKPDGRMRPLGIPTIRDRVVQMALLLVIEPIFEADFMECSYGFRPGRNAHQAVQKIEENLKKGYRDVYDADLQGYFDSIPHDKLMKCLEMRIADKQVLKVIRMWLRVPVVETEEDGKRKIKSSDRGTPQGGVISPLLANLYLHWFDKVFHRNSWKLGGAKLLRYADDFVVMARNLSKEAQEFIEKTIEEWLGLKINREKTRIVDMKKQGEVVSFLGFSFRYDRSRFSEGKVYLNIFPKDKAVERIRDKIKGITGPKASCKHHQEVIKELNRLLRGWSQYFDWGYPSKVFGKINYLVGFRLYRHLMRKSQRRRFNIGNDTWYKFFREAGVILLRKGMVARA